jgi:hypothetical protein
MSLRINGEDYYQTAEACRLAGTTRNTFLRWLKNGSYMDVECRDRRGWRLFSKQDLANLKTEVNKITSNTGGIPNRANRVHS